MNVRPNKKDVFEVLAYSSSWVEKTPFNIKMKHIYDIKCQFIQ